MPWTNYMGPFTLKFDLAEESRCVSKFSYCFLMLQLCAKPPAFFW